MNGCGYSLRPEILDTSTAMSHSGCVVALRCHLLQHAIETQQKFVEHEPAANRLNTTN